MCSPQSPRARNRFGAGPRPRWGRRAILLTIAVLAAAPRLTAQTPDQRLELERFRDSVGGTVDSVGLLALERHMIEKTKADRNNALSHLELGFLSLRLGELGGGRTTKTPRPNSSGPSTSSRTGPTAGTEWGWPSTASATRRYPS